MLSTRPQQQDQLCAATIWCSELGWAISVSQRPLQLHHWRGWVDLGTVLLSTYHKKEQALIFVVHDCLQGLLREYAPFCLKAYYDKDSRKAFCQAQLWTEPYNNMMARLAAQQQKDGGVLATTAAVVQALLVSTGLTEQEGDASSAGPASEGATAGASARASSASGGLQQSPAGLTTTMDTDASWPASRWRCSFSCFSQVAGRCTDTLVLCAAGVVCRLVGVGT
jgi:hypothetical protein